MQDLRTTVELANVRSTYGAIVIGAGPAGCGAAACLAARGVSVLIVESNPRAARRFAGEWIHPEGVRVLNECGLLEGLASSRETSGFVVCPNDGLGPIQLDYPNGAKGLACEHETLVTHLRQRVACLPGVDYAEGVRAQPVSGHAVSLMARVHGTKRVQTDLVVVAAGRSSRDAGSRDPTKQNQVSISSMAGLLVTNSELPLEGFGHVIVGGPGPALAYRIDETRVRLCIDVPHAVRQEAHARELIWESFAEVLPPSLRAGAREALLQDSLRWAANAFRPRSYRTRSGVALVGDAAGVFHPLTAMGITMALLDAEALAVAPSIGRYAAKRAAQSYVPELLSNAIYQAFVRDDAGSEAIRESIFRGWRSSANHRDRTMRLLGASSNSRRDFVRAFSRVSLQAGAEALVRDRHAIAELTGWLRWPWASLHPRPAAVRARSLSWAAPQTWASPNFFRAPQLMKERQDAN